MVTELTRSNEALEEFAYVVSHDLRAPLKRVTALAHQMEDAPGERADEEKEENVRLVLEASAQMDRMISGLLEYSKVKASKEPFETVDLNKIVKVVKDVTLAQELSEAEAVLNVPSDLPTVRGRAHQLHQLFQNLIHNAVRFRGKESALEITITHCVWPDGQVRISVADNGVGIKKEHQEKIFRIFERLGDGTDSGTGLGLAICKNVVKKQGGEIGVQSRLGKGATFWFTLLTDDYLIFR